MQSVVFLAAIVLSLLSARGAVLLEEGFAYPNGPLQTVSSNRWQNHSGTDNQVDVVSERVFLTQSESEDVSALLDGQPYAASSPVVLYSRFILNVSALPSGNGGYFAHYKDASSGFRGKIFVVATNAAAGKFRVGISNIANAPDVTVSTDLDLNTDYEIVTKYVVNSGATTLWLNPTSEASPSVTSNDAITSGSGTVVAFSLRQSLLSGSGMGSMLIDDLRIATSFGELASEVPATIVSQPANQSVTEGADVTMTAGIQGSSPLNIQWHFNGAALPGETKSALIMASVTETNEGTYFVTVTNAYGGAVSETATLTVSPFIAYQPAALSLVCYNVKGNGTTDWSTNTLQVQAIGRQLAFLQPDVITFQEIPYTNTWEMTNLVKAYLPGYFLATNSGTDGFVRSVIASRYPITRSQKWLDGADLRPFGYTNENNNLDNFSRDLFEAQIAVPHFSQPLHVFTTHLKSGGDSEDFAKRAAEASAISNFFVTTFLPANGNRPYVLTGDMNESNTNQLSIQRLISASTGLRLTNPQNPITGIINTWSTANANPGSRLDYIMPGGLMFSNINNSQVFRTDRLSPVPPGLFSNDCKVASDHLPVLMVFNNPYEGAFRTTSFGLTNQTVTLSWQSSRGRQYAVETSPNLTNWNVLANGLIANSTNITFSTNVSGSPKFFRVNRLP